MGRAGIVMGLEVSRLARNSTDWHRLLEICALSDTLILASASPRRADLLRMIGCRFDIFPSNVDEQTDSGLSPGEVVSELASRKAEDVARQHPDRIVIGADTVVVSDESILGKPADREEAEKSLRTDGNLTCLAGQES